MATNATAVLQAAAAVVAAAVVREAEASRSLRQVLALLSLPTRLRLLRRVLPAAQLASAARYQKSMSLLTRHTARLNLKT